MRILYLLCLLGTYFIAGVVIDHTFCIRLT